MEASTGLADWYTARDRLQYGTVPFWYARPGATHNRPPQPEAAKLPLMRSRDLQPEARPASNREEAIDQVEETRK
jgi:hypothetical protein